MSVLTPQDHVFLQENGYLRIPNVVPPDDCAAVVDLLWNFLGIDRSNPSDWYRPPMPRDGFVEVYQSQAIWNVRQRPRMYQTFVDLLGTEKLWVDVDRASLKVPRHPEHPEYDYKGFIHWDVDTNHLDGPHPEVPYPYQGVLYLTDTTEDMGGFQCIPGFHRVLKEWIKTQPADRNPRAPDLNALPAGMKVTPIPGNAGDLVVWDRFLAHGNGHNVSRRPRFAQYVAMFPANEDDEDTRQARITAWQERRPPRSPWVRGDERGWEQVQGTTASLTALGRKLLGLDRWNE